MKLASLIAPFRNATIGSALIFAASGAAFALANILLARGLEVEAYARFALAIAVYNVAALVAPLGMDQLSVRRTLAYTPKIALTQFALSIIVGLAFSFAASAYVAMSAPATISLAAAIAAAGVLVGAVAELRRQGMTFLALVIYVLPNLGLLMIALAAQFARDMTLAGVLWLYTAGVVLSAGIALARIVRGEGFATGPSGYRFAEALPLLGLATLGTLTLQMERLVLPALIDLKSLAIFALLSSLAIFPFRLISSGMGFALTPQLSDRENLAGNYARLRLELVALGGLMLAGAGVLVILVPYLMPWLTDGRYEASHWLVLAACFSGVIQIGNALARAIVTALGTVGQLHMLNVAGWCALALALAAAWAMAGYGLLGVILGAAAAQSLIAIPVLVMAWRTFAREARAKA
ncbi:hypothetical protein [Altererythrobacter sp. GH1-8]|uniref:hypothetical protein n=1 Tax=Altererythrobacter sp. GH1-8 TaxID=3349333 RepID=UPI00374C98EE